MSNIIPFPDKKYNIIYADPAWKYKSRSSPNQISKYSSTKANDYYNLLDFETIYKLPVNKIADDNCYLFLWVTFPLLDKSIITFEKWGFKYKTIGFNWVKTNKKDGKPFFGVGYYTKSNSEICLLGVKGKVKPKSNFVSSIIIEPKNEHSKKPLIVKDRIVELCGDLPRIELFARNVGLFEDGWDYWGNEV